MKPPAISASTTAVWTAVILILATGFVMLGQMGAKIVGAGSATITIEGVEEFQVEGVLQGDHHVDARVRGHPGLVQIVAVGKARHIDGEPPVVLDHLSNLIPHPFNHLRRGAEGGLARHTPRAEFGRGYDRITVAAA